MKFGILISSILKNMARQKTIIFSSFILPIVIILSTWWVTAEVEMEFLIDAGSLIFASMVDIHVVTGGLTAMGITAGLFGFIITADYQQLSKRLKQVGYSNFTINVSVLSVLLIVLSVTSLIAILLSVNLSDPKNISGVVFSVILITLIYAALGNLIANIYPDVTAGSLIILVFSFMDLMLFTNPMGEGLYMQNWTYYMPGFWPTQLALESGFLGRPDGISLLLIYGLAYFLILITISSVVKWLGLTKEVIR